MSKNSTIYSDLKNDFNPITWISKYRRNSIYYLTIMVLFYHLIGFVIMVIGSIVVDLVVNDYSEPTIPLTVISVIFAGPFEETLFFGIPFYLTGNNLVTLAGGVVWALLHILNTPAVQVSSLAYLTWLFVTPSIFASLRTWITGRGWFAIVSHSIWNLIFFVAGCTNGEFPCRIINEKDYLIDIAYVSTSAVFILLTYFLFLRYENKMVSKSIK
ncbi:MAG TPA: CPBP family intramembrane glutamic endopeptidase [Nitrososphaeraceae archaeon]|nr:CPBP family intramembrane glutamic endopeptidase [Nitrososphaeraceae archaeon]